MFTLIVFLPEKHFSVFKISEEIGWNYLTATFSQEELIYND
jgi:uncharacterized protein (DUF486 family)